MDLSSREVPTHEITTPKTGVVVVLKNWINGFDDEAIQAKYMAIASSMSADKSGKANAAIDATKINEANHEAIRRVVVSVDGKTDDVVTGVLSLPLVDVKKIIAEVDAITNPLEETESESSSDSSTSTTGS